jgi:hypothetical protein
MFLADGGMRMPHIKLLHLRILDVKFREAIDLLSGQCEGFVRVMRRNQHTADIVASFAVEPNAEYAHFIHSFRQMVC